MMLVENNQFQGSTSMRFHVLFFINLAQLS